AIPVQFAPHTTYSTREAPKPLLAKTIETVWNTRNNHDFLESILPPLRRHLQWLLQHFDPKRRGIHYWQNRGEPLVPELYKTDIATVDLTVLLLTEIEAFNRLSKQSQQGAGESDLFIAEKKTLERNLLEQFWNEKESAFSNAFIRDVPVRAQGFSSFIPLLWPELPMFQKNVILDRIRESGTIPGGLSVLSWHKSAMDDNSFPLLQQMLVYDGLITSDPHGHMLSDFCRLTLQGFLEWHSLTIETGNDLHINPVLAAHIINIQALHQYRYYAHGGIAGFLFKFLKKTKIDRFELSVVATVLILSLSLYTANRLRKSPPPFAMLDAQMQSAYARHDATATLENCRKIIDHYPEKNDNAKLLAANILLSTSNYSEATQLLKEVRERYPDSPGPMISLGLAHQLQGDFEQAEHNYYEFCYIFEEVFPELVQEVNIYRNLIREGFKTPPKWYKIYGYQLMHEL
ncbi:MAG TPA: tetratricopeptide repeat protein, partial [Pontiella sp.]